MSVSKRYLPSRSILKPIAYTASACLALGLLSACGGGGSSRSPAPAPAPTPAVNQAPTAAFSVSTTSGNAPLLVSVDAGASSDVDGEVATYVWDFAGTPGVGTTAQHLFSDAGSYDVRLTVTDDDSASGAATRTITVSASVSTASVSGIVKIAASTAIDRDVNDRLTTALSNNSFDEAQPIASPVTLGGYANVADAGEPTGILFKDGDTNDFYQVNFSGGEIILLSIAEAAADLDLRLWDASQNLVDASVGTTTTESIEVSARGTYYIEVTALAGASNYVLNVGNKATSNGQLASALVAMQRKPDRLSDPFVTGEVIFKSTGSGVGDILSQHAMQQLSHAQGPILAAYDPFADQVVNPAQAPGSLYTPALPVDGHVDSTLMRRYQTLLMIKALSQRDDIDYAEPNLVVHGHAEPNDTFFGSQWHYPAINLPLAWDVSTGSSDVIVAVVDTGVLIDHPDLASNLTAGYDFISDAARGRDGDGIDNDPDDPGDLEYGGSSSFHGTHVAGTIAATSDNNSGVAGVAWNARIMPVRVVGRDGGTTFDVMQGVRWAAGLSNDSGTVPDQPADIINLSLGSTFSSASGQDTFNAVRQAGILVIASAGNESSALPSYPAAYNGVISVSATTITNAIASYSNFGSSVDIAAPGGSNITDLNGDGFGDGVISTMGDDSGGAIQFGYALLSGTSMAAPHVAGVAALMKSMHPNLTPDEFDNALLAGDLTDDMGEAGRDDRYGHGIINAQKAVFASEQLANGQGTDPGPILAASTSILNFGAFATTLNMTMQNIGTGNVMITSATSSEPWLTIQDPASADGLGTYQLTLDRSALADGAYQAALAFTSDANDVDVTIIMQVTSLDLSADAGLHYVILVDSHGATVGPTDVITADQGEYAFALNDIPFGEYRLFTGTDSDDDSFLCDAGEACGAYPTLDSPVELAINGDVGGLEFVSGFRVNLTTASSTSNDASGTSGIRILKPDEQPNSGN